MSTARRRLNPCRRSSATRWPPIKPPAPQTTNSSLFILLRPPASSLRIREGSVNHLPRCNHRPLCAHEPLKLARHGGFGFSSVFITPDSDLKGALAVVPASRQAGYESLPVTATQVRRSAFRLGVFRDQEEHV